MEEVEIWKDVEGFEGIYQVSNLGRVKSLARFKRKTDRLVKGNPNKGLYLQVQLYKDRKRYADGFRPIDNPSEMAVNHKDFNVQNNTLGDLEWCTTSENNQHYWDNADLTERLATPRGETHHLAVMTEEKVKELRRLYEGNIITNKSELGRMFGCSENRFLKESLGRISNPTLKILEGTSKEVPFLLPEIYLLLVS